MTELPFLPAAPDPTRPEREPRRHRHRWAVVFDVPFEGNHAVYITGYDRATDQYVVRDPSVGQLRQCSRCGAIRDESRARRGKSAARFGKDQERRIERVYGLRKVGEFGDAIDLLGKTTKWQSRATRGAIPQWLAAVAEEAWVPGTKPPLWVTRPFAAMADLFPDRMPVLIRPVVHHGLPTVDYVFVRARDWYEWHGWNGQAVEQGTGYVVMRGETWLELHGKEGAE